MASVIANVVAQSAAAPNGSMHKGTPLVFCGITVEYTNLQDAYKQLGLTQSEVEAIMAPNAAWPLPGHQEGKRVTLTPC